MTTAAASRRVASCRGGSAVTVRSTWPDRSAITAVAPRWASRPCNQWASARSTHSANRIDSGQA